MTTPERTGQRDLLFGTWIKEFLPEGTDKFWVTDVDFYLRNGNTKRFMLLEIKCRNAVPTTPQSYAFSMLNHFIVEGMKHATKFTDWTYLGFHLIQFETEPYAGGSIYFDREEIKESELIEKLSMNNLPEEG